jgi:hypothetical protein
MDPRDKYGVGVNIFYVKPIGLQFVHDICDATRLVVLWDTDNDFGNNVPAASVVYFLFRGGANADMYAV